ncbi:hypothetical protein DUNSADRAFT_12316 [Dunaliella salina]|uniref:Encoded protein n=1 Tax=Dunaliella salina TaxID=3046 RepID=A0ABQ7GBM5_DUNSA|nr:hypothetical protein DUNSADRAFT_12316 [Dunaliella salina]|eukprot:KAF5832001.1 hypothetical protein DUNSADRAFT_12316 [Dunaliella salina]
MSMAGFMSGSIWHVRVSRQINPARWVMLALSQKIIAWNGLGRTIAALTMTCLSGKLLKKIFFLLFVKDDITKVFGGTCGACRVYFDCQPIFPICLLYNLQHFFGLFFSEQVHYFVD